MKEWVVLMDAKDEGREEGLAQGREEGLAQGREEGLAQGREAECRRLVESMLQKGKSAEEIVELCDYPYELVKSIEDEMSLAAKGSGFPPFISGDP